MLVHAAQHASLGTGAVVGEDKNQGVVEQAAGLEVRDDPADLRVGVSEEACEDLHLPRVHSSLVRAELIPGGYPLWP